MPPRLKKVDLPKYGDLMNALNMAESAMSAVREFAVATKDSAEQQVQAHLTVMQKHLDRKDLRPHVHPKPLGNNKWAIAFNDQTYGLGPYEDFDTRDPDDPRFWWMDPTGTKHPSRSMFQALLGIVLDYCNKEDPQ